MPTFWRPIQPYPEGWLIETGSQYYAAFRDSHGSWTFAPISDGRFGRIEATEPADYERDEAAEVETAFQHTQCLAQRQQD